MVALALLVPLLLIGMMFVLDAFEGFLFPPPAPLPEAPPEHPGNPPDHEE
ncbi:MULTISPECIES: hypothetical protein [unclassified Streptomyces]